MDGDSKQKGNGVPEGQSTCCNPANSLAIVLAGGDGEAFGNLVGSSPHALPKPLVSLAQRPLIWYTLKLLETQGFKKALVSCSEASYSRLADYVSKAGLSLEVTVHLDKEVCGTVEALTQLQSTIREWPYVLVVSCDLLGAFDLAGLLRSACGSGSNCCMLLLKSKKEEKKKKNQIVDDLIVGANTFNTSTLSLVCREDNNTLITTSLPLTSKTPSSAPLCYEPTPRAVLHMQYTSSCLDDSENELKIERRLLSMYPRLVLLKGLRDPHIYLFKTVWLLEALSLATDRPDCDDSEDELESIQYDLLPHMLMLYRTKLCQMPDVEVNPIAQSCHCRACLAIENGRSGTPIDVSCVIQEEDEGGWKGRVNDIGLYLHASTELLPIWNKTEFAKQLPIYLYMDPSSQYKGNSKLIRDSIISSIPDGTVTVKKSIVGANVVFGSGAKVMNSVVGDNCVLADNCSVINSVLVSDVKVEENAKIRNCDLRKWVVAKGEVIDGERHPDFCESED